MEGPRQPSKEESAVLARIGEAAGRIGRKRQLAEEEEERRSFAIEAYWKEKQGEDYGSY